jgi:hypothetical protein
MGNRGRCDLHHNGREKQTLSPKTKNILDYLSRKVGFAAFFSGAVLRVAT